MYSFYVLFSSVGDIKQFAAAANHCVCEVDAISGRYVINAKSIMGLFSLDQTAPIRVEVHGTQEEGKAFEQSVAGFVTQAPAE